jgi:hypothetical protein
MAVIKWTTADRNPPAKERLFLIVSAAGSPPDASLLGKGEIEIGYWTGDTFRLMHGGSQPLVTHWARVASCLPDGVDLVQDRRTGILADFLWRCACRHDRRTHWQSA